MKGSSNSQKDSFYAFTIPENQNSVRVPAAISSDLVRKHQLSDVISQEEAREIAKEFSMEEGAKTILTSIPSQGIVLKEFLIMIREQCYIAQSVKDWNRNLPTINIITSTESKILLRRTEDIYDPEGRQIIALNGKKIVPTQEKVQQNSQKLISIEESVELLEARGIQNATQIIEERMRQKVIYDSQGKEIINLNGKEVVSDQDSFKKSPEDLIDFHKIVEALNQRGIKNSDLIVRYFNQNILNGASTASVYKLLPPQNKVMPWTESDFAEVDIILDDNHNVIGFNATQIYKLMEEYPFSQGQIISFSQSQIQDNQIVCRKEIRINPNNNVEQLGMSEVTSVKTTLSSKGEIGKKVIEAMEYMSSEQVSGSLIDIFLDTKLIEDSAIECYQRGISFKESTRSLLEKAQEKQSQLIQYARNLDIDKREIQSLIDAPSVRKKNSIETNIKSEVQKISESLNMTSKQILDFLNKGQKKDLICASKLGIKVEDIMNQDINSLKSAISEKAQEVGSKFNMTPNQVLKFLEEGEIKNLRRKSLEVVRNIVNSIRQFFPNIMAYFIQKIMSSTEKKEDKIPSSSSLSSLEIKPQISPRTNKENSQNNDRQP